MTENTEDQVPEVSPEMTTEEAAALERVIDKAVERPLEDRS